MSAEDKEAATAPAEEEEAAAALAEEAKAAPVEEEAAAALAEEDAAVAPAEEALAGGEAAASEEAPPHIEAEAPADAAAEPEAPAAKAEPAEAAEGGEAAFSTEDAAVAVDGTGNAGAAAVAEGEANAAPAEGAEVAATAPEESPLEMPDEQDDRGTSGNWAEDPVEEAAANEEDRWRMPEDFFYEEESAELLSPLQDNQLAREGLSPARFLGFDFLRHYNLMWVSKEEFAYVSGHVIVFINSVTGERRFVHGRDSGGIGAMALSTDGSYFAVAERSTSGQPNVYIYEFKTMRLYRILRKGTLKGYASVQFSPHNKHHIAALGCAPDYLLTVWDWTNERLLLKCKAYGQDVFGIRWGQFPGMLTTVGVGHIRFWKMALTFTGLKLQGDIGKFGATELSDIVGFVELPDGKVVTGSEYGRLLLWEGVFVKVELMRGADDVPTKIVGLPHAQGIEVILFDSEENCVVTGGDDGHLRWWPVDQIDVAEADYDLGILEYGIGMKKELRLPPYGDQYDLYEPAHIHHVARSADDNVWLIQDNRNGIVWKYEHDSGNCSPIVTAHSGPISGTYLVQNYTGLALSAGIDGSLRAFNLGDPQAHELFLSRRPGNFGITHMVAAPQSLDGDRRTVCCGYTDGTIRVLSVCKDGFVLIQAVKPHTCPVKQVGYSIDGRTLATLGMDNTLFIFEIRTLEEHGVPLGFVQLPSPVNHFAFSETTGNILLAMEDGTIIELMKSSADNVDNSETYAIDLDYRSFQPEVPEIVDESDSEDEEDEDEDGEDGEDEEDAVEDEDVDGEFKKKKNKKKRKEEEEEAAKVAANKDDDEEETPKVVLSTVTHVAYCSYDRAYFVGTGVYSGGLWEISIDAQTQTCAQAPLANRTSTSTVGVLRTKLPKGVRVTHLSASPMNRFMMIGFEDGRVWAVPFVNMMCHSAIEIADSLAGSVHSVSVDAEETLIVVGAADGSLTAVQMNAEEMHEAAARKLAEKDIDMEEVAITMRETMPEMPQVSADDWDIPDTENPGFITFARDIMDAKTYSIQEAKLKTEEDHAMAQAEQKKKRVRERVAEIRQELEVLHEKNTQIPANRLSVDEVVIDQEHITYLKGDMENKIEEVRSELAWTVEFHERGMQKLREFFLNRLDFERIEVLGFRSPHRVATFRCPAMSPELQSSLARLHELIFAADQSDDEDDSPGGLSPGGRSGLDGTLKGTLRLDGKGDGTDGALAATNGEGAMSGAELRELRRQQRQERKQQMQELERSKPSDTYEDPQDLDAIAQAEATLGNYMLKTSDSYQVPENQRMNAEKKRRQMFLLEESMHAIKTEFNNRVLALRDFRQQVRAEVNRDVAALQEIDGQLGTQTDWVEGLLDDAPDAPSEFPEKRFDFDDGHLKSFRRELRVRNGDADEDSDAPEPTIEANAEGVGEEGEDGDMEQEEAEEEAEEEEEAGEQEEEEEEEELDEDGNPIEVGDSQESSVMSLGPPPILGRSMLAARRIAKLQLRAQIMQEQGDKQSSLNKAVAQEATARLWHDKAQLEEHIRQVIETFNNAVASIEKEKAKLESDLKNADMKLLVLYEELLTLNDLEEKDEALLKKAMKCRQDKTAIMHQIKECQDQLGEKKAEIDQWHSEEQNLQQEFMDLVGDTSPYLGALLKIYKKKVKRSKRKKPGEEEDFDEDEEEEEEESEMESDEDEDDMDDDVGPPPGCDVSTYESVIDIREKRLDMEDALQDIQRAVEELKKTHKNLLNDEKRIDKEQKQTDAEIQQFQTDKQRKLNQVEIVFALRLSQVQCLGGGEDATGVEPTGEELNGSQDLGAGVSTGNEKLPPELGNHVVFTQEGLHRLMSRITELHQEIREVKASHKQLQRDFRVRKKEKNQAEQHIEDLQAKFQDIQMLKFGQIVDLDLIERSAPDKYVQELRERVGESEVDFRSKLGDWEKRIEKQKREMAKVTCENTSLMEQIVSMGYSQMQLDAALNARIANVTVNDNEPLLELRDMERERMKDLLTLQSKEIATLQAEINLFRKKGGHIYTTVTANRKPAR